MEIKEIKMHLNEAIEVKKAALRRAANTEKDPQVKALRTKNLQEMDYVQNLINNQKDFFNETTISKQK